jgi:hypothetical protein
MISARSILLTYYLVILGPFLAFVISPAVMIAVFATRSWRSLASPWVYVGASVLVLYVLAVVFIYLAFVLVVDVTGMGVFASRPPPGTPPLGSFKAYAIPVCIYFSLAAFGACSIAFLRYLRSLWSK